MFGFHPLDLAVIGAYFAVIVTIGLRVGRRLRSEEDYSLGDRRMGFWLQMFMNFGTATNVDSAVGTARETFRQGMAGIWLKLFVLFVTPFYWITTVWIRRLRLSAMSEIFSWRFGSPAMARLYAVFGLLHFVASIAVSQVALQKTVEALTPVPPAELSAEQQHAVRDFSRWQELKAEASRGRLTPTEAAEWQQLRAREAAGEIRPFFSRVRPEILLTAVALGVLAYALAGGIMAAAATDLVQGLLLLALSVLLLPMALWKVGGFAGLQQQVPPSFFDLFGSPALSDYPWYHVAAIALMGLVSFDAEPANAQIMGSAKDEETARVGRIAGNFTKRLTIILWGFTGVVGFALYRDRVSDPDMLWGYMTLDLLPHGLIGLMVVCLMAALMSTVAAFIVSAGALFTQTIYRPWVPGRTDGHYLFVGRLAGAAVTVGGTLLALYLNDLLQVIRFMWSIGLVFGPVFFAGILWRRTTAAGAWAAILYSAIFTVGLSVLAERTGLARTTWLTAQTAPPSPEGQMISRSSPIYFERLIPVTEAGVDAGQRGTGRFRTSLIWPGLVGADYSSFSRGSLLALSYFLDVVIPFMLMFLVSLVTRRVPEGLLVRFFARLHTPVAATLEEDAREVARSEAEPDRWRHAKLAPRWGVEFLRPTRRDILGFLGCWVGVGLVVLLLMGLASLGT